MDEKSVKRRNWIKNIAIIFLAVMLILTLFSNTFLNYSLPEVATQYSRNGTITTQVRGTGTVQARDTYSVVAANSSKIVDVGVKVGAEVAIGDVLFLLDDDGSAQLIDAITKLTEYRTQYNDTLEKVSPSYADKLLEISNAKEDLAEARTTRAEALGSDAALAEAKTAKRTAEKAYNDLSAQKTKLETKITSLEAEIAELEKQGVEYDPKDVSAAVTFVKLDYENAKTAAKNAQKLLEEAETALERANDLVDSRKDAETEANDALTDYKTNGDGSVTDETVLAKERALEQLNLEYDHLKEDYQAAVREYENSLNDLYMAYQFDSQAANEAYRKWLNGADEEKEALKAAYDAALETAMKSEAAYQKAANDTPSSLRGLKQSMENKAVDIKNAEEDLKREREKYDGSGKLQDYKDAVSSATDARKAAEKDAKAAEKAKEDAEKAVEDTKAAEEKAKTTVELFESAVSLETLQTELTSLETQLDAAETAKDQATDRYDELNSENSAASSIDKDIKELERKVEALELELATLKETDAKKAEIHSLELKTLAETIKKQEALVAELSDSEKSSQVTSPVAGTVTSLKYVAGESMTLGETIAEIQLTDKGYLASISATAEQASRIKAGDTATVEYYWGRTITAVVDAVRPDPANPSKNRLIDIAISGDVTVGTSLTFAIGERSQSYDCIVPLSALRKDSDGDFVLTVESKSTPLGNRYTARRVNVTILAQDDSNAAVQGLSYSEYVITTSSKPIQSGQQVRLIES